jgi:hypothetical protein
MRQGLGAPTVGTSLVLCQPAEMQANQTHAQGRKGEKWRISLHFSIIQSTCNFD